MSATRRCRHGRTACWDSVCKANERKAAQQSSSSNLGQPSINTDGHMAVGLGGGLAMDMSDGSLGVQVGGVTIDFGN